MSKHLNKMEINMNTKRFVQLFVVMMIVLAAFVNVGSAFAWGGLAVAVATLFNGVIPYQV